MSSIKVTFGCSLFLGKKEKKRQTPGFTILNFQGQGKNKIKALCQVRTSRTVASQNLLTMELTVSFLNLLPATQK